MPKVLARSGRRASSSASSSSTPADADAGLPGGQAAAVAGDRYVGRGGAGAVPEEQVNVGRPAANGAAAWARAAVGLDAALVDVQVPGVAGVGGQDLHAAVG